MKIRVSLRYSFLAVVAICLLTGCVMKKGVTATASSTTKSTKRGADKLERVIVTGSRLPTEDAIAPAPTPVASPGYVPSDMNVTSGVTTQPSTLKRLQRVSIVKLFYATDRKWTGSTSQPKWFGSQWNEPEQGHLTYGTCDVSIPVRAHKIGDVEKPSIVRLELSEDADKHVIVYTPLRLARAAFFTALENDVRAKQQHEIMVFIHGFNNTFDDAASRLGVWAAIFSSAEPQCYTAGPRLAADSKEWRTTFMMRKRFKGLTGLLQIF